MKFDKDDIIVFIGDKYYQIVTINKFDNMNTYLVNYTGAYLRKEFIERYADLITGIFRI